MGSRRETAMDQYFNEFVPMLEEVIRGNNEIEDDDPTIDLECMQVARREPTKAKSNTQLQKKKEVVNRTFELTKGKSCSLDELCVITEHLKKKSSYGDKLIAIMLDGLEKSIPPYFYRGIIEYGPPVDWLPIVKRNNEDTPYVEFLIKNVKSDEEPFSQISDYSLEHLALSKFVMDQILTKARQDNQRNQPLQNRQIEQASQNRIKSISQDAQINQQQQPHQQHQPQQQQHQLQQLSQPRPRVIVSDKTKRCSLPPMTCSTPIRQRQATIAKRASTIPVQRPPDDSLNDSKRVLPPRACKTNATEGTYKKYLNFSITNGRK